MKNNTKFNKVTYYHRLKNKVAEAEKKYDIAIDELNIALSRINRGIIHGKKEEADIKLLKANLNKLMSCSFAYELASYQLNSFLKDGVIKYE